tara:strand:+ start:8878 stop:9153 length:276 start_codon:yes stop_codon:yes gene_type:complete
VENKLTIDQQVDLALLIATFRCFNEQLYSLKGIHSKTVKQKFNRLLKVARRYDDEISKQMEHDEKQEQIYDALMDIICDVKIEVLKDYNDE